MRLARLQASSGSKNGRHSQGTTLLELKKVTIPCTFHGNVVIEILAAWDSFNYSSLVVSILDHICILPSTCATLNVGIVPILG